MISLSGFLVGPCGFPAARSPLGRFNRNREDGAILRKGRCIAKNHVRSGGWGTVIMLLAMDRCKKMKETEKHTYGKFATMFGDKVE